MIGQLLAKVIGTQNDRELKRLWPVISKINALESSVESLSDADLRAKTAAFKERVANGEELDDLLPEAFAVVREAGRRVVNMRHYDVQLIGGMVLHTGKIAEMKTGEGKTLVATLPAYLNALQGKGVHVVTVNDYLARRDSEWMGKVYRFLGLSVGVIQHELNDQQRQVAYGADITYGTNNEFGFDYLRDNMKFDLGSMVQRGHHFAIVDEVDSILIDEARTPLIISGPAEESTDLYYEVDRIIPKFKKGEVHQGQVKGEDRDRLEASGDYVVDEKNKTASLTESGMAKAEQLLAHRLQEGGLYDPANMPLLHHVHQALRAHVHYHLDVQYMIKDGQVVIVDEFTGRLMPGRRWSDGLHQAVEAKEGVKIERENQTLATITFQNYFRKYKKLSGMTGTAETEAPEFGKIYNLDVMVIPTNRPLVRVEEPDSVYRTEAEKWQAIVEDIAAKQGEGRPVLVGTVSIEKSERLSGMLKRRGTKHVVLNAKYHAQEAEIVAQAGRKANITIATNMAGRGTDILLGGNPEYMARQQAIHEGVAEKLARGEEKYVDDEEFVYFFLVDTFYRVARADWDRIFTHFKQLCEAEHNEVVAVGGLHIIGTERHEARRIDNQLRGRAGRQGDPGSSRFYLSLEDDLMRIFGSDRISGLMQRLGMEEGVPIEHGMVTKAIERAQRQVEAQNFSVRKHLLEYDDVMNKQRESVYTLRREILEGKVHLTEDEIGDTRAYVMATAEEIVDEKIQLFAGQDTDEDEWDLEALRRELTMVFGLTDTDYEEIGLDNKSSDELRDMVWERVRTRYEEKEKIVPSDLLRRVERDLMLQIVDAQWKDHLYSLDHLKEGIGLRGYGQRDPLVEYKKESFTLFQDMRRRIEEEIVRYLWWLKIEGEDPEAAPIRAPRPGPRRPSALSYNDPSAARAPAFVGAGAAATATGGMAAGASPRAPQPARVGGDDAPIKTVRREEPKIGRNDPCWCGSGKKFKKCHGA
ncbi:MAG TPA: preprotein translocase subunit SecA [Vicinamibacterales bacterium]|nr:preprotein translocase subunit SecA [Vicinamibacterales bacterium]